MNFRKTGKLDSISNVIITIFAALNIFPLYWMFTGSFKTSTGIDKMPPDWICFEATLNNYIDLFRRSNALRWTFNSFYISVVTTLLIVVISSMAAYAFSKLDFWGRKASYIILISTLMIPHEVLVIPLFKIVHSLGWYGTYQGVIIPNVATAFGVFLLKQFIDTIPDSIRESAKIDGSSEFKIFLNIILPMAKPGISALFIIMFVRIWNDYLWQLVIIKDNIMNTLQLGIASMQNDQTTNYAYVVAGTSVATIPMLIVFLIFQRYFTKGITVGAVKE